MMLRIFLCETRQYSRSDSVYNLEIYSYKVNLEIYSYKVVGGSEIKHQELTMRDTFSQFDGMKNHSSTICESSIFHYFRVDGLVFSENISLQTYISETDSTIDGVFFYNGGIIDVNSYPEIDWTTWRTWNKEWSDEDWMYLLMVIK